jgi:hypothetical protein
VENLNNCPMLTNFEIRLFRVTELLENFRKYSVLENFDKLEITAYRQMSKTSDDVNTV